MGQTLTHGIYLPDEGERNCYNGLAANWNILDGAVGTVAEHTSALSGKAPLVHTHSKADITDFPVYGTTAGTICEGNDSRLSDARTPVAHTHTKSDIKNLFNSANSWTENNTYAKYILMKNTTVEVGNAPSNSTSKEISFTDKNNKTLSRLVGKAEASGNSYIFLHATNKYTNGALDPNGSAKHSYFYVGLDATGKAYNKHAANTFPDANNTYDLGSSSYQWNNLYVNKVNTQSVNGVNPGALSLPKGGTTENVDYYNVATAIKPLEGTSTNFSGAINYYQATTDGWLSLVVTNCTDLSVWETNLKYGTVTSGSVRNRQIIMPVLANHTYEITIQGSAWFSARLMPCQGNV